MRVSTDMEIWVEVRRRVLTGELSKRAACREYEIHWQTLEKILSHSEPPGYQKNGTSFSKLRFRCGLCISLLSFSGS